MQQGVNLNYAKFMPAAIDKVTQADAILIAGLTGRIE